MTDTPHLGLPLIAASQSQKHVTHNEAIVMLDAIVMLSVIDSTHTAPPGSPAEGDRYKVASGATGAWAAWDLNIALYTSGQWVKLVPKTGWLCFDEATGVLTVWDGSAWTSLEYLTIAGAGDGTLTKLGILTAADNTNRLAVKSDAILLSHDDVTPGTGDLRVTLNKKAPAKVLSLLMQSGWAGRAEIGLVGDDDLHVRVSDDGATWRDSIVIAAATGKVSFPQGALGVREKLTADRTYYVRPDGSDSNDGLSNNAGGAFATIQKAVDVVFGTLDLGGFDVTIQLADGNYSAGVNQASPQVGAGLVTIQGNAANPENVVVTATGANACIRAADGAILNVKDFEVRTVTTGFGLLASTGASISYANMRFGPTAYHHIRAEDVGSIRCLGNYAITGNGLGHWCSVGGGILRCQNKTITIVGMPAFSIAFVNNQINGMSIVNGNSFSGSATGKRYDISTNSVVYVAGASSDYLPGDAAGTTATGGQYG